MSQFASQQGFAAAPRQASWFIGESFSPRFEQAALHRHDGYEFFLHVRGGGFYQLEQHVFPLQPYELLIIRPHQLHGPVGRRPLENFERLLVQISADTLGQLRFQGVSLQGLVDEACQLAPGQVLLSPQEYLQLKALVEPLPATDQPDSPLGNAEALGFLTVFVSRLCRLAVDAAFTQRHLSQDDLLPRVRDYILGHFMGDCSLDALAEQFNISKFHLSRRFSEKYGVGLHQYVQQCRMAYAQQLIRQGEPMMSISYQCGFNDYSSFVRAFTRFYGSNPRAWRKQLLLQRQRAATQQLAMDKA